MSEKILLYEGYPSGNISDFKQKYEIYYYPREIDKCDKIALYIFFVNKDGEQITKFARRSIFFSSIEQLQKLIDDLSSSTSYFMEKRGLINAHAVQAGYFGSQRKKAFLRGIKADRKDIRSVWP